MVTYVKLPNFKLLYRDKIEQIVSVCHKLAEDKYVTSTGGNVSCVVDRKYILITPSKVFKGDIKADDICVVNRDGEEVSVGKKPSGEISLHLAVYNLRPDITSIIHAHPPYSTALAISDSPDYLEWPLLPEVIVEIGPVKSIPYREPLSKELADVLALNAERYDAFLMKHHGITVLGKGSVEETRQRLCTIECTAQSIAMVRGNVVPLSQKELAGLETVVQKRGLPLPGRPGAWANLSECYKEFYKSRKRMK